MATLVDCIPVSYTFASPDYQESVALREYVLRKPLGLNFQLADLATEYSQIHLGLRKNNQLVACLVLKPESKSGLIKMRQVAVLPDFQRQGLGRELVEFSEQTARQFGFQTMELHAREQAVPFYLNLGYQISGEPFLEINMTHYLMTKDL